MTMKTDYGDKEVAHDDALAALESVFNTSYTSTKTPVHHTGTEGGNWFFVWDYSGYTWRFEVELWSGNIYVLAKPDNEDAAGWETILEHTN